VFLKFIFEFLKIHHFKINFQALRN